jgi:hypothetical protein
MFAFFIRGIHAAEEFTDGYSKAPRYFHERSEGWDALTLLNPAHGDAMQARVIGEGLLGEAFFLP